MTTANKITIFRILLVPFFVLEFLNYVDGGGERYRMLAIICFALASVSDGVDGYIARRYHQRSELGAILDPLADKLLLVAGIVLLSFHNEPFLDRFPLWLSVTIISRDALILLGMVVIHYVCGRVTIRPRLVGKIATVLQMTAVSWALLKWPAAALHYWSLAAAICTALSGLLYVFDGVRQLSQSPASLPKLDQGKN